MAEYRNEKNFAILLTELGRVLQPFASVELTEDQTRLTTIHGYIEQKILVPFTTVGDVVLPPGVEVTTSEFGHVIEKQGRGLPGTGQIKTVEEVVTVGGQKMQEKLDEVGEDLKKNQ